MVIYKTTNLINNKIYIGKDEKNNPNYFGSGKLLKKAINKYGIDNFKKEIIETCENREILNLREKFWIKELKSIENGYNMAEGGTGGKVQPIVWNKNKTYEELFGENKAKLIKEKLSNSHKGYIQSEETKKKRSEKLKNRTLSEEHKNKIREKLKGSTRSEETKLKISNKLKQNNKNE